MSERTFTSSGAFVAWMHEVYLAELVLVSAKPKPPAAPTKRPPRGVAMVWGQRDLAHSGAKERFETWTITATRVTQWTAEGLLDADAELTVGVTEESSAALLFRLKAGGTATLACGEISVTEGAPVLRKARPRPWQGDFAMFAEDETRIVGDLLAHTGATALVSLDSTPVLALADWTLASLRERSGRAWMLTADGVEIACIASGFRHDAGWTLTVQRRATASDEVWERVWGLPVHLGAREVRSRTLVTDPAGWATWDFRRGATA